MLDTQREPARPSTRHQLSAPDRARTILTFAAAVTANVAIFAIARAVDVDFIVPDFGSDTATTEITAGHVVGASVAGLVVGWVALVLATKIGRPAPGSWPWSEG